MKLKWRDPDNPGRTLTVIEELHEECVVGQISWPGMNTDGQIVFVHRSLLDNYYEAIDGAS